MTGRHHALCLLLLVVGCGRAQGTPDAHVATSAAPALGTAPEPTEPSAQALEDARLDRDYPLHGLVTGLQLSVRAEPNPDAQIVGWLRIGARVRLKSEPRRGANCATGWYELDPTGWACAGQGIEVGPTPPTAEFESPPPSRESVLPYTYWFVKDDAVPEYHRPPSRNEQRAALAFSAEYLQALQHDERRAGRLLTGEIPATSPSPVVAHRYLDRGFYVAGVGVETRAFRRFVRTVRGRFIKQSQLEEAPGAEFRGIELDATRTLPVAWAVREAQPMILRNRADGTIRFVADAELPPIERHAIVEGWAGRRNVDGRVMHVLPNERFVRDWFLSVAEKIDRPREVAADEPWVHVDLDQQTLVLYVGDTPTYATLVSTGQEGFETQPGIYTIRRKYVADTMANIGDSREDNYSIEDVPWTQYFDGSYALHGAFWHNRFGLPRSHGCVNLSPGDAHRIFDGLWPHVPRGWLGVTTDNTAFRASHVVITSSRTERESEPAE